MFLTGLADEAGAPLKTQIEATKELGWENIEARNVQVEGFETCNMHDIPDKAFDIAVEALSEAGVSINAFGSTIGNWAKKIDEPFDSSLAEAKRAIPRMQRLGTKQIRIMSFAIREGEADQMEEERFRRMRELTQMFTDADITPVHENCMNYGGMAWPFTLKLLENVPNLKLVFDTGNPVFNADRTKPKPYPKQDPWEFYTNVKDHIVHVHVKDLVWDTEKDDATYTYPGEGDAKVRRVLKDLISNGYDGGISIEPHMAVIFHDTTVEADPREQYDNYVEYGRRMAKMIDEIKAES
ncbi:MAG TPA: sugar phosphate isomerase/epimerase [Verrucomicrobiales bacterium]|jgi:sugar phosphate isomerase/epimerase|nr:sugar phosphate isomerase/epimerase [Verrucomicrobiales bacterium]